MLQYEAQSEMLDSDISADLPSRRKADSVVQRKKKGIISFYAEIGEKKSESGDLELSLLISLIIILPEYFRLAGQPVYQYLIVALLIVTLFRRQGIRKRDLREIGGYIGICLLLCFISRVVHLDFSTFISYLLTPTTIILCLYLYIKDEGDIEEFLDKYILIGFFICILGFVEVIFEFNIFSLIENVDLGAIGSVPYYRNGFRRIELSYGTAIGAGIYTIFINATCLYKLTNSKAYTRKWKRLYLSTYVLSAVATIMTFSRMPTITLFVLQMFFFGKFSKNVRYLLITCIVVFLIFDLVGPQVIWSMIFEYWELCISILSGNTEDLTAAYRLEILDALWPNIKENLIFGHGKEVTDQLTFYVWGFNFNSVDNNFLFEGFRYGIAGILLQMLPFIFMIRYALEHRKESLNRMFLSIVVVYIINLVSVAQMSELRAFCVFVPLSFKYYYCKKREKRTYMDTVNDEQNIIVNAGQHDS